MSNASRRTETGSPALGHPEAVKVCERATQPRRVASEVVCPARLSEHASIQRAGPGAMSAAKPIRPRR